MFGEYLISKGVLTKSVISEALEVQKFRKTKLGRLLRDLGYLIQEDLDRHLKAYLKPNVAPSVSEVAERVKTAKFPGALTKWANGAGIIPYQLSNERFVCLTTHFSDQVFEDADRQGIHLEVLLIEENGFTYIKKCLEDSEVTVVNDCDVSGEKPTQDADPYGALFRDTVLAAKSAQASDIHIQPTKDGVEIRFRINGELIKKRSLSTEHRQSFINEIKRISNLSIAMSGRAQDGRVSFRNWNLDVRASLLPSQHGEKIVLRLLDLERRFELEALGLDETTLSDLKQALRSKNGVIIISGPTGSGKTTTLYTLLSSLDRTTNNIITLEDPIEYGIPGLTQVQVGPKLKFSEALRAILRQDPDVILVGEVRDSETAGLCVQAALTGHLVLSTLHANGAKEVISRLTNLGVDPYLLKSCLKFSAAQRLVKKLCPACLTPIDTATLGKVSELLKAKDLSTGQKPLFGRRNKEGCNRCDGGIVGRTPILEYMKFSEIQEYLNNGEPRLAMSLAEAALRLARKGEIDVHEVLEIE